MAKVAKKPEGNGEISVTEVSQGRLEVCILGMSPLIYNAMSEKARHELLMPAGRKNAAERASSLKHVPIDEYRNSVYKTRSPDAKALLAFPAAAFKKAMASAALDMAGAAKAEVARLVWAEGDRVEIFGVPQLMCAIVRSSDMNHTPDVRTRAILPEWACRISFTFMKPKLNEKTLVTLLAAAGMIRGIGDWRQEKGSGSYGQFQLVSDDDENFVRIVKEQGRKAQTAALETASPAFYDDETEKLILWFNEERVRRTGDSKPNGKGTKKTKKTEESAPSA